MGFNSSFNLRTPADDAPPFDPAVWANDCAFLTVRAAQREAAARSAATAPHSTSNPTAGGTIGTPRPENHTLAPDTPRTLWARTLRFFWPHIETVSYSTTLREISIDDLSFRLQAALNVGDVGIAMQITRELARRKAQLKPDAFIERNPVVAQVPVAQEPPVEVRKPRASVRFQ